MDEREGDALRHRHSAGRDLPLRASLPGNRAGGVLSNGEDAPGRTDRGFLYDGGWPGRKYDLAEVQRIPASRTGRSLERPPTAVIVAPEQLQSERVQGRMTTIRLLSLALVDALGVILDEIRRMSFRTYMALLVIAILIILVPAVIK